MVIYLLKGKYVDDDEVIEGYTDALYEPIRERVAEALEETGIGAVGDDPLGVLIDRYMYAIEYIKKLQKNLNDTRKRGQYYYDENQRLHKELKR